MKKEEELVPPIEFLEKVAKKYAHRDYRERFIFDATKKTGNLSRKISHNLDGYFMEERLTKDVSSVSPEAKCWMFESEWEEGSFEYLWDKHTSGYPCLIIAQDLSFMYGEEEF